MTRTGASRSPIGSGRVLAEAVRACADKGFARIEHAWDDEVLVRLRTELDAGPFQPFGESFGPVRQQIDGYDVSIPSSSFPLLTSLCRELRDAVRVAGADVRGLATWSPNEVGIAHYVAGSIGITPHMDGKWYRRLVAVLTVYGRAPFAICGSRDPVDVIARWDAGPGDLVLMRAPGLAGRRDGRPFHLVAGPPRGERQSIGIRMSDRPQPAP
jgi:hypothetical protein